MGVIEIKQDVRLLEKRSPLRFLIRSPLECLAAVVTRKACLRDEVRAIANVKTIRDGSDSFDALRLEGAGDQDVQGVAHREWFHGSLRTIHH